MPYIVRYLLCIQIATWSVILSHVVLQVGPLPIDDDSTYVQQYADGHIPWVKRPGDDLGDTGAMVQLQPLLCVPWTSTKESCKSNQTTYIGLACSSSGVALQKVSSAQIMPAHVLPVMRAPPLVLSALSYACHNMASHTLCMICMGGHVDPQIRACRTRT